MGDVVPVGDGDRLAAPDVPGLECLECREPCERRSARLRGLPELLAKLRLLQRRAARRQDLRGLLGRRGSKAGDT